MRLFLAIMMVIIIALVGLVNKCNKIVTDYYEKQDKNCYSDMTQTLKFDHEFATKWCSSN